MSSKANVYDWYKGLSPKWRGIMLFTGTVVAVGTTYIVVKSIKKKGEQQKALADQKIALDDAHKLEQQGMVATYDESTYKSFGDEIFSAMDGYMTDEAAINEVMGQMKNDLDVKYLILGFGVREISSGAWNPEPNYSGGLAGAMRSELSSWAISDVNDILKKNGVTFKF